MAGALSSSAKITRSRASGKFSCDKDFAYVPFVLPRDSSPSLHTNDIISEVISYVRRSNIDEVFIAAELQSWIKLREPVERLRLLPAPVHLMAVGPLPSCSSGP